MMMSREDAMGKMHRGGRGGSPEESLRNHWGITFKIIVKKTSAKTNEGQY